LELLDVAETLHRQGLKFEFRFIGFTHPDGSGYLEAFQRRIKPMEAAGYARYGGAPGENELRDWYDGASAMVHFPTEDAAPMVVLEGLGRDLKFFGARVGGILDTAGPMPGTELFEPDDWPGLTAAIARWIAQKHPRPVGNNGIIRDRYHPVVLARRHVDIYREVLAANGRINGTPSK
jgi:glycosyltransferase involved in cell wall biosynthesis